MSSISMSLKARIRNLSKQKNIAAQVIMQNYMFERLLKRLSVSEYKDKFVIKGGMLIAAIVGLGNRATMDLDTTLKNLSLSPESIRIALEQICSINLCDDITFAIGVIYPIREDDIYGGYKVILNAVYDTIITPLSIDVSSGDIMTPHAVRFSFHEMFNEKQSFELWAYNIETVLAEKLETILVRNVFSTRPRDFYDVYILLNTQKYDKLLFFVAIQATASHRGTTDQIQDAVDKLKIIAASKELQSIWERYRKQFAYAEDISYQMVVDALVKLYR